MLFHGLEEDVFSVVAGHNEQARARCRSRRRGGDRGARKIGEARPTLAGTKAPGIAKEFAERFPFGVGREAGAAEEIEGAIERSGGKTSAPQIFINGESIGGCDDLVALERAGKLDALLAA